MRSSPVPIGDQMATPDRVAAWISALMSSKPRISAHCRSSCAKFVSPDDASHSACGIQARTVSVAKRWLTKLKHATQPVNDSEASPSLGEARDVLKASPDASNSQVS